MLSAAQRLRRRGEFTATVRGGRRAGRGVIVVHLALPVDLTRVPDSGAPPVRRAPARPSRAGFVVPKAVGPAVDRNHVKRRLRHLVRDRLAALPPGSDLVVRALPGAADRPYSQLAVDFDGALAAATRGPARRPVRK